MGNPIGEGTATARAKAAAGGNAPTQENRIVCPFCGRPSRSTELCTRCGALFNKEVRSIAFMEQDDPRPDRIGPFTTRTAKILLWIGIAILILLFAVLTNRAAGF